MVLRLADLGLIFALVAGALALLLAKRTSAVQRRAIVAGLSAGTAAIAVSNLIVGSDRIVSWLMLVASSVTFVLGVIYFSRSHPPGWRWLLVPVAAFLVLLAVAVVQLVPRASSRPPAQDTASKASQTHDFDKIAGELPPSEPIAAGAQLAPVGSCVSIEGAPAAPALTVVDCGSPKNGFKVVQRVATPNECVADVDQRFYLNPDGGQFTACLDYAWSNTDCLSIGKYTATRVACAPSTDDDRERPVMVIAGSTSISGCTHGGFAHAVRRFTVCTETQK